MNNPYHDLSHQMNNVSLGNNHSNQIYQYGIIPSLYSSASQVSNASEVAFVDSRGQAPYSQDTSYTTPLQSIPNQYSKLPAAGQFTSAPSSYQSAPNFSSAQQNPIYFQQGLTNSRNILDQQNMNHQTKFPDFYSQNIDSRIPKETLNVQRQVQSRQDLIPPNSALPQQVTPQAIQDPRRMQLSRQPSQNYQQNGSAEGRQDTLPFVKTQQGLREQQFTYYQQGQMQQGQLEQQNQKLQQNQQQQIFNQQYQQATNSSHLQQNQPGSVYLQNVTGQRMPPQNVHQSNPQAITSQQYNPQTMPYQGMQPQGTLQQNVPQQSLQNQDLRHQNQGQNNAPSSWEKFDENAHRGVPDRNSTDLFQQYVQQRQSNQSVVNDTERLPRNQSEQLCQSDQKPPAQMSQIRYPPPSVYPLTSTSQFPPQPSHLQQVPPLSSSLQTQFQSHAPNTNENFHKTPQNAQLPDARINQRHPSSNQHDAAQYPSQAYTQQYPNEQKIDAPNQNVSRKTQRLLDQQAVYATQTDPSYSINKQNIIQASSQPIQTSQYKADYPKMDQSICQNVAKNGPCLQRNPVAFGPLGRQNMQDRNQLNSTFGTNKSQAIRYERNELPFNSQTDGRALPTSSNTLQRQGSQNQPIQSQAYPTYSNLPQSENQIYAKTMDDHVQNGRLPSLHNPSSLQSGVTQYQPYQTAHPSLAYANQNKFPLQNPAGVYDKKAPFYNNMSSSHQVFQNQATPVSVQSQIQDPSQQLKPSQQINPTQLRNPEENARQFQDTRNQYQRQNSSQNNSQNSSQNTLQDRQYPVSSNLSNPDWRNSSQVYSGHNPINPSLNTAPLYQYQGHDRPQNTSYPRSNTVPEIQDQMGLVNKFQRLNSNEGHVPNPNQNIIQDHPNPSQPQYNPHMNIRNPSINPGPRFMNPNNPPGNLGVYPPAELNLRAGPYDATGQHNMNRQASGPSQPIVIMPGVTNTRPTQENFEPRIESIFEQISDKQGPMFEKLRKILVEVFNIQDDVFNFKGRRGEIHMCFLFHILKLANE